MVSIRSSAGPVFLRNNIILHSSPTGQALLLPDVADVSLVQSDYNVIVGGVAANGTVMTPAQWVAAGHDAHSGINAAIDSLVVSAVGLPAGDYHLPDSSPAVDVGMNDPAVTVDADGNSRPQRETSSPGAYEWVD